MTLKYRVVICAPCGRRAPECETIIGQWWTDKQAKSDMHEVALANPGRVVEVRVRANKPLIKGWQPIHRSKGN